MATEMPFDFLWCNQLEDGEEQCGALPPDTPNGYLLIGSPDTVTPIHIDITNKLSDKTIDINPINGVTQADANNYHFKLTFNAGTLVEPNQIGVDSENWSICSVSDSTDTLYLLWIGNETISLAPHEATEVILTGVAATWAETKTTTTNVTIRWPINDFISIRVPPSGGYATTITLELEMMKLSGKSNIPLFVGFVGSNKVLNTHDELSSLQLRLTNTNLPDIPGCDITFHYDSDAAKCSQLVVVLEVGTLDVPWALGTQDDVSNVGILIGAGDKWQLNGDKETISVGGTVKALKWTFIPKVADVVLAAQETMLINLSNIKTAHPTGETNLYLCYQYIDGYQDGQFACQIEKAPLVLDTKVRIGTRTELPDRLIVKDGISLENPGSLNFGSRSGQHINLYSLDHAIGVQGSTTYFRTSHHFGWYQGGSYDGGVLNPGSGIVQMVINEGNVGIGTASPSAKLDVKGRIKDITGYIVPVGTIVTYAGSQAPEGWWLCNGGNISKTAYPELFDVIGYTYGGSGDNFTLPDLRGRVPVGLDTSSEFNSLGKKGGEKTHTLTTAEMPSHSHSISDPSHSHSIEVSPDNSEEGHVKEGGYSGGGNYDYWSTASSSTGISIQNQGGGGSHNNLQPYFTVNYIIKC